MLANQWIAAVLGFLFGVGLLSLTGWSSRFVSPKNADVGMYVVMGAVLGGLFVALGALALYRWVSPEGFLWFAVALIAGFVVGIGVLTVTLTSALLRGDKKE